MATDYNVKHPKLPYEGTYPNLHVSQDAAGNQILKSLEPGKEAYFEVMASGSYYGHAADGSKVEAVVGKTHGYHGDGHSQTIDGFADQKVSGSMRSNSDGSRSSETAGDSYSGGGGHQVTGSGDSQVSHSSGDVLATTEGNHTTQHDGNVHHSMNGDMVNQITGNKHEIITGEWGLNNQGGNMDVQVDAGKMRLFAGNDILVESATNIILKVGGSTITITPSGIVIKASKVDINP